MAFPKAIQNVSPEAHAKYVEALMEYKASCSMDAKLRKLYKNSLIPEERLRYWDFHEKHSEICKAFYAAKNEYAKAHVTATLKARGMDISALTLAEIAGVDVPLSMKEIISRNAQEKAIAALAADPAAQRLYEQLQEANKETENVVKKEPNSSKARFLTSVEQDPTLGDFEGL